MDIRGVVPKVMLTRLLNANVPYRILIALLAISQLVLNDAVPFGSLPLNPIRPRKREMAIRLCGQRNSTMTILLVLYLEYSSRQEGMTYRREGSHGLQSKSHSELIPRKQCNEQRQKFALLELSKVWNDL